MRSFATPKDNEINLGQHSTNYIAEKQHFLHVPYSVSGWRGYVDSQCSLKFLHFHCEQKGCVWHFLHFLFDELSFCGLLEVFGLGDLVHKAHDLAGFVASSPTLFNKSRVTAMKSNDTCVFYQKMSVTSFNIEFLAMSKPSVSFVTFSINDYFRSLKKKKHSIILS